MTPRVRVHAGLSGRRFGAAAALALLAALLPAAPAAAGGGRHWVGAWEAAPGGPADTLKCADCTVRNVVHTTAAGTQVRIRLSNLYGTGPLVVAHATVALPVTAGGADVAPGTLRQVTFGGKAATTVSAGRDVLSDPVRLTVPAGHDLLVTVFAPGTPMLTWHYYAAQTTYLAAGGDRSNATAASAFGSTATTWFVVSGVQVSGAGRDPGDVVAFGDSITDGYGSTANADHRWPDDLAGRLTHQPAARRYGVLNAGIGGNRVLLNSANDVFGPAALARFDRDALTQPGVRSVILMEGINDIQMDPRQLDATKIVAGLRELSRRAHARGLKVTVATLTPDKGWSQWTPEGEQTRQAVNAAIRTGRGFDTVVDFDAVVRDPADPQRLRADYDSGDHIHPGDAGYAAMAAKVDLSRL